MTDFPHPERRGLERQQRAPKAHPDADLLTAFSEQTATVREREQVLAHLAVCTSCREVVSLAALPNEEAGLPQAASEKRPIWEWPLLRWGSLVASLAVVVIAVYIGNNERRAAVSPMTSETAPLSQPSTIHEEREVVVQSSASPGVKAPEVRYEKVAPKPMDQIAAKKKTVGAVQSDETVAGYKLEAAPSAGLLLDRKTKDSREAQNAPLLAGAVQGTSPETSARDKVPVLNKTDSFSSLPSATNQNESTAMAKRAAALPPPTLSVVGATLAPAMETVNVAKQAVTAEAAGKENAKHGTVNAQVMPQKGMAGMNARTDASGVLSLRREMLYNSFNLQWQVTPEGYLLNSNDNGKSWIRQLPDQRFTHVQTIANHVWASDSDGSLMHSTDGGMNWTRVVPSEKDAKMTGDVTSIVFLDVNHGTLKTSTNETWSTMDAGQTWKKQ